MPYAGPFESSEKPAYVHILFRAGKRLVDHAAIAQAIVSLCHCPPHRYAGLIVRRREPRDFARNVRWSIIAVRLFEPQRDAPQFLIAGQRASPIMETTSAITETAPSNQAST